MEIFPAAFIAEAFWLKGRSDSAWCDLGIVASSY